MKWLNCHQLTYKITNLKSYRLITNTRPLTLMNRRFYQDYNIHSYKMETIMKCLTIIKMIKWNEYQSAILIRINFK